MPKSLNVSDIQTIFEFFYIITNKVIGQILGL